MVRPIPDSRREILFQALALTALCAVVWGRTLAHGFVWDDEYFILKNGSLRSWGEIPRYFTDVKTMAGVISCPMFRPLRNISWLIDFKIAGLAPAWWHFHNLALHAANSMLALLIARRLLRGFLPPLFAAALFLVHPVQSEPVSWLKCRDDFISSFYVLLAFLLWLRWRPQVARPGRLLALGALFILAFLAKESVIAFPAALLLLEWIVPGRLDGPAGGGQAAAVHPGRTEWRLLLTAIGWLGAVCAACIVWRSLYIGRTAQGDYLAGAFWPTMLTMVRCGADYLRLLLYPATLVADYSGIEASTRLLDFRVLSGGAILGAALGMALAVRRRAPVAAFGLLWVPTFLLPVSNLIPTMQYMAERFLYLPLVGFSIAAGSLLSWIHRRSAAAAWIFAVVILGACSLRAERRARDWKDEDALYEATLRDTPESATRPRYNRAVSLVNAGRLKEAAPLVDRLYEWSRGEPPKAPIYRASCARNKGYILLMEGETTAALELLREAATASPDYAQPLIDMGWLAGSQGRHAEALDLFTQAVNRAPKLSEPHYNRAIALRELGRPDDATAEFQEAIHNTPGDSQAHRSAAALLWKGGRFEAAAHIYRQALEIWPFEEDLLLLAAKAEAAGLWEAGRYVEAGKAYRDASRHWPDDAELREFAAEAEKRAVAAGGETSGK